MARGRKRAAASKPNQVDKQTSKPASKGTKAKGAAAGGGGSKGRHTSWLFKSEPESRLVNGVDVKFGLADLRAEPGGVACWDGVRNYQARNNMRDMRVGQRAFFYHSNCKVK